MSNKDRFVSKLSEYSKLVDENLDEHIANSRIDSDTLRRAMEYSLKAGGKRIRPVLMLAIADVYKMPFDLVMPFACALEMIHTYSLIHDDLPAMDDDDLRRGIPTSHKVFGEGVAILAGDALLNLAYEIILDEIAKNIGSKSHVTAARYISAMAGASGMISGQVLDLETSGKKIEYEALEKIHTLKTVGLITAPVFCAATLLEIPADERDVLGVFACNSGMVFQIVDDILDVVGDEKKLGKPIGSDASNQKNTFVEFMGIQKANDTVDALTRLSIKSLKSMKRDTWFLQELSLFLAKREH